VKNSVTVPSSQEPDDDSQVSLERNCTVSDALDELNTRKPISLSRTEEDSAASSVPSNHNDAVAFSDSCNPVWAVNAAQQAVSSSIGNASKPSQILFQDGDGNSCLTLHVTTYIATASLLKNP
jgi:hypothetical protein